MNITGKFEWQDYMQSVRLNYKTHIFTTIFWTLIFLMAIFILLFSLIFQEFSHYSIFAIILFAIIILSIMITLVNNFIVIPINTKKYFYQDKELQIPFIMEIENETLTLKNEESVSIRKWIDFIKWRKDKNIIMLYISDIKFIMLPKRMLTQEQQENIINILNKNNIKEDKIRIWDWFTLLLSAIISLSICFLLLIFLFLKSI
jgi:hypothetical protein